MAEIVHVASIDSSRHMGPGRSVPSLCRAEVALGRDAIVINEREGSLYDPAAGDAWRPVDRGAVDRAVAGAAVVHFNGVFHPSYLRLTRVCRRHGVPYVVCPRSNLVRSAIASQSRIRKEVALALWVRRLIHGAAALHFLTPAEARASRTYGAPVIIAPNGVTVPGEAAPVDGRSRRITFVGRVDIRHKGLDRLVDFTARWRRSLTERGWEVRVHGPDHRAGRAWMEARIRELRLEPVLRLLDPVSADAKAAAFRGARLFVHPSRFEGQPQAVLEAMAEGCPVAVSAGSNLRDEVLDAGCGFGWEALLDDAPAVLRRLERDVEVRRMGDAARRLVADRFTWPVAARRTLEELDRAAR